MTQSNHQQMSLTMHNPRTKIQSKIIQKIKHIIHIIGEKCQSHDHVSTRFPETHNVHHGIHNHEHPRATDSANPCFIECPTKKRTSLTEQT